MGLLVAPAPRGSGVSTTLSCHGPATVEAPAGVRRVALVGNPNVGKSLFFNALTGLYVDVSNYPGTTVAVSTGRMGEALLQDTPGIYGVAAFSDDERVARDVILAADAVINVVDAVHLTRDLFLTQQLIDMRIPLVVALNLMDEAEARGIRVDAAELSRRLGVPVVETVATTGRGMARVQAALAEARPGVPDEPLQRMVEELLDRARTPAEALLALEEDPDAAGRCGVPPQQGRRDQIYFDRRRRVNELVAGVLHHPRRPLDLRTRLGHALIHPLTGLPVLAAVLYAMYQLIGVFVAQTVVGFTEGTLMQGWVEPWLRRAVLAGTGSESLLGRLLAGEFGVLTMTATYVVGLLLPLVVGFYLALSLLEDSGYLPRIAALADRLMTSIGLNGRAVIPLILGFGCVTMATITTRILGSERERKIATALMAFATPCSAQLGVITALLAAAGGLTLTLAYVGIMVAVFGLLGLAMARYVPGTSTDLLIDLPPLRVPRPGNVLLKTSRKTAMFLREVTAFFAAGALLLGLLEATGLLASARRLLAPLTVTWLGLPEGAATVFIMGFVRRDFGAAGLYDLGLGGGAVLVALVTITLFVPCIASVLVIMKERGRAFMAFTWAGSVVLAFAVGGIVARVLALLERIG
jgi:ferrous iron transport protein B